MPSDLRATEGFVDPDDYDRGRPPFPADAVAAAAGAIQLGPDSTVLDLGAGSGALSGPLASLVRDVVAVEPSRPMLHALRQRLPSVDARNGTAEEIPLGDHSVDAVFVAEAFHWFQTDRAAREIVRVLVPRGHLVLVWQRRLWWDRDVLPWIAEFEQRLEPFWEMSVKLAGEHPNVTKGWQTELEGLGLFDSFSTVGEEFVHHLSVDDFLAFVSSWSWIAILPPTQRRAALSAVRELFEGDHAELALPYRTEFQHARVC